MTICRMLWNKRTWNIFVPSFNHQNHSMNPPLTFTCYNLPDSYYFLHLHQNTIKILETYISKNTAFSSANHLPLGGCTSITYFSRQICLTLTPHRRDPKFWLVENKRSNFEVKTGSKYHIHCVLAFLVISKIQTCKTVPRKTFVT